MRLYKMDVWIQIKDRPGLAKALALPAAFKGDALAEKLSLSYDRIYGDRKDMMHFFHGQDAPQSTDVVDYDGQKIRDIVPYLGGGGMILFPFTGKDVYAQYLFRDGQIIKMHASIIWHVPDANYISQGSPAFPSASFEQQMETVKQRQRNLFPDTE